MKQFNKTHILAIIVLVAAGSLIWLRQQKPEEKNNSLAKLEEQDPMRAGSPTQGTSEKNALSSQSKRLEKRLDSARKTGWKKLALHLQSNADAMPSKENMELLTKLISEMSESELCKAMDEIASLQLFELGDIVIRDMMSEALAEKNPVLALKILLKESKSINIRGRAATAFNYFLKLDATAAIAWYDQHKAAGLISDAVIEKSIVMSLVKSNPDAAARRLNQMGENSKISAVDDVFDALETVDKVAFANFFRSTIPEDDRAYRMQYYITGKLDDADFGKVTDYLDRFDATPEERIKVVESVTSNRFWLLSQKRKVTREDLENYRTWVSSVEPSLANKATGIAIAKATGYNHTSLTFQESAAIASEYHAANGGDEVLIPLLQSHVARFIPEVREDVLQLATKISDEKRRQELLSALEIIRTPAAGESADE